MFWFPNRALTMPMLTLIFVPELWIYKPWRNWNVWRDWNPAWKNCNLASCNFQICPLPTCRAVWLAKGLFYLINIKHCTDSSAGKLGYGQRKGEDSLPKIRSWWPDLLPQPHIFQRSEALVLREILIAITQGTEHIAPAAFVRQIPCTTMRWGKWHCL